MHNYQNLLTFSIKLHDPPGYGERPPGAAWLLPAGLGRKGGDEPAYILLLAFRAGHFGRVVLGNALYHGEPVITIRALVIISRYTASSRFIFINVSPTGTLSRVVSGVGWAVFEANELIKSN